ncbi:TetR/AcrR family transcriptional regulator [Chryseobacterium shandongense]|jgi:AcrR family transcriptional regulator|uniref:TetR/AcrR family transcriptional regulator n=2 Tax=Chryseobacterium TaxID=59732 RepID=A0A3G6Q9H8_9FLAO|nr:MULTISPECIES: TetR/AcrR family transcriptional regulator [Chryseobacterium]AZA57636.1 TetR/AcrR family transcriptional regulator [Chryseobacterium shandongense]AZA85879.1 TetR/AcrR family transcriptional regulator [Chryseobacterium shandongense]AZA94288.1 TetR/AcrR family transcriptional regulator [Chryseobacterium shandongense]MEA1848536.1 TetR/AcrR family transcriptional regulator [Chryseobacterium sp. MHB01]MEC5174665.1 AcrR family transcriptional regulator [Chryseobacterium nepalense]
MARKVVQGPIRDKEKTKQKLLGAVGKILRTKGYSGLKVSKIAAVAGFDKKLIYEYFGSTEKLIDEYIRTQDYWSKMNQDNIEVDISDGGRELSKMAILNQYEHIKKNKELQKIILWGLSESKPILKKIADEREEMGEMLFKNIVDPYFQEKSTRYRAIAAVLVSGAYYLNLYTAHNASMFCGIDLKSEEGRKEIEKAITEIIDFAYDQK